jgi:type IV pilus assembly protein PilF
MNFKSLLFCCLLLGVVGCTSQTSRPGIGEDFDQQKAAKTRVSLGLTYLKNGNFSQAKFNLDKALEFAPRSADAHYAMAYYYQAVDEISAAEKSYQTAMDLAPNNPDIANSYGAFMCGQGKYAQAKSYFLKAVNSNNYISSAETYENLALCSQSQGYQSEATEYLRSAVNHQPGRSRSLFLLTQSLVKEQRWLEAKDVLKKYEKVAQISADSLLLSSQIESALGNVASAQSYGAMLLKIYPDSAASAAYRTSLVQKATVPQPVVRKSSKQTQSIPSAPEQPIREASENALSTEQSAAQTDTLMTRVTEPASEKTAESEDETTSSETISNENKPSETVPRENTLAGAPAMVENSEKPLVNESPQSDEVAYHVVQKGENLYRISLRYNIRMQRLIEWNKLSDAADIYAGKKLRITSPEPASEQE